MAKLFFRHGTMGAGKSLQLLAAAHNYLERGLSPLLFTFAGDNRFGSGVIASRTGLKMPARSFTNSDNFLETLKMVNIETGTVPDAIFVDEAQFLTTKQVEQLHDLAANWGIPVLCYGLRVDFLGRLFEGSAALFAHAEDWEEMKTICHCGKKATHVARFLDGVKQTAGETIQIGDSEYVSMCYTCYTKD
ncbi:MAG: thymidine kinase [Bacteroidales bacterium]